MKNKLLFLFNMNPDLKLYNTAWEDVGCIEYIYFNKRTNKIHYYCNHNEIDKLDEPAYTALDYTGEWLEWKE